MKNFNNISDFEGIVASMEAEHLEKLRKARAGELIAHVFSTEVTADDGSVSHSFVRAYALPWIREDGVRWLNDIDDTAVYSGEVSPEQIDVEIDLKEMAISRMQMANSSAGFSTAA